MSLLLLLQRAATASTPFGPVTATTLGLTAFPLDPVPFEPTAYHEAVLADNPNFLFMCAETAGNLVDSTANNLTGTANGSIIYGAAGPSALAGTAVTLDGSTGYFTVPDGTYTDLGDVFTLECCARLTSTPLVTNARLLSKGTAAYALTISTAGQVALIKEGSAALAGGGAIADTSWHHIVATKNGASIHVYVDGTDVTGTIVNQTLTDTATALQIGRAAASANYFNGSITGVAVYPTVLSSARVLAHYQAGFGAVPFATVSPTTLTLVAA